MGKIPRSEPQVGFKPAMMSPTSGEGYESVGKAMKTLGQGIQSVGSAVSSLQGAFDEQNDFDTKLALAQLANEQNAEDARTYQEFNPDTGDIDNYASNRMQAFENRAASVMEGARSPRAQRSAALHIERMRGGVFQRNYGYQTGFDEGRRINNTRGLIEQEFGKVAAMPDDTGDEVPVSGPMVSQGERDPNLVGPTPEEGADVRPTAQPNMKIEAIGRAVQTVEQIVKALPVDDAKKQQLYGIAAQRFMESLGTRKDAKDLVDGWLERNRAQAASQPQGVQGAGAMSSGAVPDIQDFSRGRGFGQLAPQQVKHIVLHDVSGPGGGRLPKGGSIGAYHITFDDKGIYQEVPFDRRAPHATTFNDKAIGIAHIGYEGDKLSPQAIANGARAVQMVSERYGISPENILRHPELGAAGTRRGSKDPREASWREDVLAYIKANPTQGQPQQTQTAEAKPEQRSMASRALTFGMPKPAQVAQAAPQQATDAPQTAVTPTATPSAPAIRGNLTAYAPQAGASNTTSQQGNYLSSRPGPDGKNEVRTLDDFANGRSPYITLAGNPSLVGKEYTIPRIEYRDPQGNVKVLENVRAVVHDTGGAFKTAPEGRFDIPVAKDVGADVRNANHALWKKAGVEFIPAEKGQAGQTQVAQRGTNQIPGQPQQAAQAFSPLGSRINEALMKAKPSIDAAYNKQVEGTIKTLEEFAVKGREVNDATFARIAKMVERTGDPVLSQRMELLQVRVKQGMQDVALNEQELTARIQQLEQHANKNGTNTAIEDAIKFYRQRLSYVSNQIGKDPYTLGVEARLLPTAPAPVQPGVAPEQLQETLTARLAARDLLSERYGKEVAFLTPGEQQAFTDYLSKGSVPSEVRLGTLRVMYDALGKQSLGVMKEIAKDAPELATVSWLVANNGDPAFMKDAIRGLDMKRTEGFVSRLPDKNLLLQKADALTGITDPAVFPEAKQYAMLAAQLAYEARAAQRGLDPKGADKSFNEELWKQSLQEAFGANKSTDGKITYGGIGFAGGYGGTSIGSKPVFVPPFLRQDGGFDEIMSKLRVSDFVQMSPAKASAAAAGREEPGQGRIEEVPSAVQKPANAGPRWQPPPAQTQQLREAGVQALGVPATADGKPVPLGVIRNATPVWWRGSQYLLKTGTVNGEPEYLRIKGAENVNFVLDLEKLRPLLEPRVAPGTFRPDPKTAETQQTWRDPGPASVPMSDDGTGVIWDSIKHSFRKR